VQVKIIFKFTLIFAGIALLFAALFFDRRTAGTSYPQLATSMPTPDRLAKPTLPASPSQADYGAQVYWLSCLPCHGDRGQGLTDEFREVYPPEDRDCWNSGCHGRRPYQNGFTLPTKIPALVGQDALQKFPMAANLHGYIFATMPFWKPGSLTEDESWQVTAFLLRQNGFWQGTKDLNETNAGNLKLSHGLLSFMTHQQAESQNRSRFLIGGVLIGLFTILVLVVLILKKSRNTTTI
jgi:Cytochrome C oxidase, cbb3-type, subunit III